MNVRNRVVSENFVVVPASHGLWSVGNQTTKLRTIKIPQMKTLNKYKKIIGRFTKKRRVGGILFLVPSEKKS